MELRQFINWNFLLKHISFTLRCRHGNHYWLFGNHFRKYIYLSRVFIIDFDDLLQGGRG